MQSLSTGIPLLTPSSNIFEPPETKPTEAVRVEGLSFGYGPALVFQDFSFYATGPIVVLEGPSGCGKTTLLRILAGHLHPSESGIRNLPQSVRLILQDDGLFPWLTAEGNLALVSDWSGFEKLPAELHKLADSVKPYASRVAGSLSFGQRRVLELLRVLAFPTPLILLDEPLNFLDHTRRTIVTSTIGALAAKGRKFVITSHYESDFNRLPSQRFRFEGDMPYRTLLPVKT